jgi:hypothetical protein
MEEYSQNVSTVKTEYWLQSGWLQKHNMPLIMLQV